MYGEGVLVVLTCYSRPANMPAVIQAWRDQSVPVKQIVVVDNRPYTPTLDTSRDGDGLTEDLEEIYPLHELSGDGYDAPDDVWRWTQNSGCPCWLAPALMLYGHRYVLRADDDLLPGRRAIEGLLECAAQAGDNFATIGQVGRTFPCQYLANPPQYRYDRSNVKRGEGPSMRRADLTCRASLVRADMVQWVPIYRNMLLHDSPELAEKLVGVHDDFLLCMAAQQFAKMPSYVIPQRGPEYDVVAQDIPNGTESVYRRPNHYEERQQFVDLAVRCGWRSLV